LLPETNDLIPGIFSYLRFYFLLRLKLFLWPQCSSPAEPVRLLIRPVPIPGNAPFLNNLPDHFAENNASTDLSINLPDGLPFLSFCLQDNWRFPKTPLR